MTRRSSRRRLRRFRRSMWPQRRNSIDVMGEIASRFPRHLLHPPSRNTSIPHYGDEYRSWSLAYGKPSLLDKCGIRPRRRCRLPASISTTSPITASAGHGLAGRLPTAIGPVLLSRRRRPSRPMRSQQDPLDYHPQEIAASIRRLYRGAIRLTRQCTSHKSCKSVSA